MCRNQTGLGFLDPVFGLPVHGSSSLTLRSSSNLRHREAGPTHRHPLHPLPNIDHDVLFARIAKGMTRLRVTSHRNNLTHPNESRYRVLATVLFQFLSHLWTDLPYKRVIPFLYLIFDSHLAVLAYLIDMYGPYSLFNRSLFLDLYRGLHLSQFDACNY